MLGVRRSSSYSNYVAGSPSEVRDPPPELLSSSVSLNMYALGGVDKETSEGE